MALREFLLFLNMSNNNRAFGILIRRNMVTLRMQNRKVAVINDDVHGIGLCIVINLGKLG